MKGKVTVKEILRTKEDPGKGFFFWYLFEVEKDGEMIEFAGKTQTNENGKNWIKEGLSWAAIIDEGEIITEDLGSHGEVECVYVKRDWDASPPKGPAGSRGGGGGGGGGFARVEVSRDDIVQDCLDLARDREISVGDAAAILLIEAVTGNYRTGGTLSSEPAKKSGNPFG